MLIKAATAAEENNQNLRILIAPHFNAIAIELFIARLFVGLNIRLKFSSIMKVITIARDSPIHLKSHKLREPFVEHFSSMKIWRKQLPSPTILVTLRLVIAAKKCFIF